MSSFSTPAIMLRRIDFGDYDLIITFFTLNKGKISVIAKSAKKSTKRFAGILELFSVLDVVYSIGRGKGLPILQEATLKHAFSNIRSKIIKTAYASYWAELINQWMEEGQKQVRLFQLFRHVLSELDLDHTSEEALSILFQIRFMTIAGLGPNLKQCSICQAEIEKMKEYRIKFDLSKGGIICDGCASGDSQKIFLSKGTIKHLLWIQRGDLTRAARIKFASQALTESLKFLEAFVPYHLGKEPRSLKFLRQIRG
jgi:DNA repair protein RecO (recombination protein O)